MEEQYKDLQRYGQMLYNYEFEDTTDGCVRITGFKYNGEEYLTVKHNGEVIAIQEVDQ